MKKQILSFLKMVYTKTKEHKIISLVGVVIFISLLYYFFFNTTTSTVTYQYGMVKRGTLSSMVSSTGQVTPNSQVELKPKVNANVTGVYVKAGDRVKRGQVLFRLDATDAYKQVRDAKISLLSAKISLEKLRTPKTIDIMSINDSIKQEEETKKNEDIKVNTAYKNLLNANTQAVSEVSYTTETAPTITGSYLLGKEGQLKIAVYQGGSSGYSFSLSGLSSGTGQINTIVAQPLGDTGLYIKWNGSNPQTNWIIDIPNKQSSSYSSNYTAWQNAVTNRDTAIASSDRTVASLKQRLADLTPSDDNLDVQSASVSVQQRENALTDAEQNLSNYVITAPFDGVMEGVSVDVGSSAVMASSNSSAALGTIVTDKKLAQITLNESDIVKVALGQKASVTFDAVEGLVIDGSVVEINTLGTVTSGVVTYKVKIAFNASDARILPNMSASVDILTANKDDVLYVPNQAVKHDTNGYYVEEDISTVALSASSTMRRFNNASSSMDRAFATTTSSSTRYRNGTWSSTRRRSAMSSTSSSASSVVTTLKRVPVTIGIQSDIQTEITSGLTEGESVVIKKTTSTGGTASAPSITSLLRPQGGNRPTGTTVGGASRGQ